VCIDDLQVGSMSKSSSRIVEVPDENVAQKPGLNKATAWIRAGPMPGPTRIQNGVARRFTVAVPTAYTGQTFPRCSHVAEENRQTQALFARLLYGPTANADHLGAIGVLARGQGLFSFGGTAQSGHPLKQEPTEVAHAA
jgi:putative transposase